MADLTEPLAYSWGPGGIETHRLDLSLACVWPEITASVEQRQYAMTAITRLSPMDRGCFMHTQSLLLWRDPEKRFSYVEGRALSPDSLLPALHAWLVLDGSVVVDMTWTRNRSPVIGPWSPDPYYYEGQIIDRDRVRTNMERTGMWTSVLFP